MELDNQMLSMINKMMDELETLCRRLNVEDIPDVMAYLNRVKMKMQMYFYAHPDQREVLIQIERVQKIQDELIYKHENATSM